MMQAVLLTLLAGMATGAGGILGVMRFPKRTTMAGSMGFAAGVMVAVSLLDLLPHALGHYQQRMGALPGTWAGISLLCLGMATAGIMESLLPQPEQTKEKDRMLRTAALTTLVLMLHNLPEGVVTLFGTLQAPQLGVSRALAVALHNLPEGVTVALPLYYATGSRTRALLGAFASGLTEPLAALLAYALLGAFLNQSMLSGMLAWTAGIMCWISLAELLPSGLELGCRRQVTLGFGAGLVVMVAAMGMLGH